MTAANITNQNHSNNMENFSEKKKRGRPQSCRREYAEEIAKLCQWDDKSTRHQINMSYVFDSHKFIKEAGAEVAIWGMTSKDPGFAWPKGFQTAAVEMGKYIYAGADESAAVEFMAQARKDGVPFGDIAAHFKRFRLGNKEADAWHLTTRLVKFVNEYAKTFPNITQQQMITATENLRDMLIEDLQKTQQPTPTNQ